MGDVDLLVKHPPRQASFAGAVLSRRGDRTLQEHAGKQLESLCEEFGLDHLAGECVPLLRELLGGMGSQPISEPVQWPSFIADDHTPVEFSLDFGGNQSSPTVRLLVEHIAPEATARTNLRVARQLTMRLAQSYQLPMDRFEAVADLFLPDEPQGSFSLWHSVVLRPDGQHEFKVYFNPAVRGAQCAPGLIEQALDRLELADAYDTMVTHAFRAGGMSDKFAFFGLDLSPGPHSRIKVYVAHRHARAADMERAARAGRDVPSGLAEEFCDLAGGSRAGFSRSPLLSCYAFVNGDGALASDYTLHLPIRDYVTNDRAARDRAAALLERHGAEPSQLDRALKAIARRPLDKGVGLISYVSLRMGQLRPGVTVYLSSEAYGATPRLLSDRASQRVGMDIHGSGLAWSPPQCA